MLLRHRETERVPGLSTLSALTAQPAGLPWQPVDKRKDPRPVAVIRVPKLWSAPPRSSAAAAVKLVTEAHGLDAFGSEADPIGIPPAPPAPPSPPSSPVPSNSDQGSRSNAAFKWAIAFLIVAGLAAAVTWQVRRRAAVVPSGTLAIETTPAGLDVAIDGTLVGKTPFLGAVAAGSHVVQVGSEGQRRELQVVMTAGATVSHHLEMAPVSSVPSPVATSGSLQVQADLPGMAVAVDGVERGVSPLTVGALAPGEHQVVVRGDQRTVRRNVTIKAGETMSLVISPAAATTPAPGWLSVSAPLVMQLREGGQIIGTTESEKVMLTSGEHHIEIVNESVGFKSARTITVSPGKTASLAIELPQGLLSINAQPWAEVWIDGERVGETPIANHAARLGSHEVLFRHPQFGERRETVLVTARQPARIGVDLRR
jgi:hypothetical protein